MLDHVQEVQHQQRHTKIIIIALMMALLFTMLSTSFSPQTRAASLIPQKSSDVASPDSITQNCSVTITITQVTADIILGTITIKNLTRLPITHWKVGFNLPTGWLLTQLWNAQASQSGQSITVYGSIVIPAGGSISIGFVAIRDGGQPITNIPITSFSCIHS